MLRPTMFFVLVTGIVSAAQVFDTVYALTGGGPGNATQTLSTYIYDTGFRFFNVGPASAASVLMLATCAVLVSGYIWKSAVKRGR